MSEFIIYGLVDPGTKQLRYIGKSINGTLRARSCHTSSYTKFNTHKNNWLKSLVTRNLKPNVIIIQEFSDINNNDLYQFEIKWIAYFKNMGCPLTNGTDGGPGRISHQTEETKAKISKSHKGMEKPWLRTKEVRLKVGKLLKGKTHTVSMESRRQMSRSKGGKLFKDQNGNIYFTLREAFEKLNIDVRLIHRVLNKKAKQTHGFYFEYLGE